MPNSKNVTPRSHLVPLAQIAKQAKVDPKQARSRLRRAINAGDVRSTIASAATETRWAFPKRDVAEVKSIISN